MIKKPIKAVTDFHNAFGLGIEDKPNSKLPKEISKLRFDLMKEENEEYLEAAEDNNLVEIGDALGDMLYILCGSDVFLSHLTLSPFKAFQSLKSVSLI